MYRWVVNDNPARNTRIMITICTPTMHDTIIRKMVRGLNTRETLRFFFPLELTFPPSLPPLLTPSAMMDRDFPSHTKIRTRFESRARNQRSFSRFDIVEDYRALLLKGHVYIHRTIAITITRSYIKLNNKFEKIKKRFIHPTRW